MIKNQVKNRPNSCKQILNDKHLWALCESEFNVKKEFKNLFVLFGDSYEDNYIFKITYKLLHKTLSAHDAHCAECKYSDTSL